jgi:hypothetical protein
MTTSDKKTDYKSILVIVIGMFVISYIFKTQDKLTVAAVLIKVGVIVGILSLVSERLAKLILLLWEKLALVLGWINTRILLSLVFYLVVFPFSWLYKATTRNALFLKNKSKTLYTERNHTYTAKDMENTW